MKYFSFILLFVGLISLSGSAQTITSAQNGNWSSSSTWVGGVVPAASNNVIIAANDTVTVDSANAVCTNLTVNAGGAIKTTALTGPPVTTYVTPTGTVNILGAWIQSGSDATIPGALVLIDNASTVTFNGTQTALIIFNYGNLNLYTLSASVILTSNLTVNGNLNIGNGLSTNVRGISALTGTLTHTIMGNVVVNSTTTAFVGVRASSTATPVDVSCTWNIHGNVTVTAGKMSMMESPFGAEPGGTATFNIDGDLIIGTSGIVQLGSSSSGTIGTGNINLKGNVINNTSTSSTGIIPTGTNTATTTSTPTLNINLVGTSQQTWTGPGPTTSWKSKNRACVINIDNPNNVKLNNPLTINGNDAFTGLNGNVYLKLTNGKLLTDAVNILTVTGSTVIGGNSTSFVNGPMISTLALAVTPTVLTFPIGKGSIYRPISLSITQDSAKTTTYMAEVFNTPPAVRNLPGALTKVSTVRYWNVTKGSGATVVADTITINYGNDDRVTDIAHLRIAKDDGAGNWVDLGGTGSAPLSGSIVSTNAFTSFGDFTLANAVGGTNDLPVELTTFTASTLNNSVSLQWSTATENQNSGWNVERSKDNKWEKIGFVKGNGNSFSVLNYSFIDKTPLSGNYYYRLKQIDYNGSYKYSKSVEINIALPVVYSVQNYPNPFNPSTVIRFAVPVAGMINISVFNTLGEKVATILNERVEQGVYERTFNGNNLATGVYVYRLTADNFTLSKKMILMK